jgi:prepilin-type N-terminal cleavage/methylation domain-containing protein
MSADVARRSMKRERGFSLIELLIAMVITLLLSAALAGVARPARAAFDAVPAELELQQRGRTAIDALSQALRASLRLPDAAGVVTELTAIVPATGAARGVLFVDQPGPGGAITLGTEHCPNIMDVCGFTPGAIVMIEDGVSYEVFSIAATDAAARRITPASALSQWYPSDSTVVEVDQLTFQLDEQSDGSYSLIRETAAGAIQPIADSIGGLSFDVTPQHVAVSISVEPSAPLRPLVSGRTFRTSITLRNAP